MSYFTEKNDLAINVRIDGDYLVIETDQSFTSVRDKVAVPSECFRIPLDKLGLVVARRKLSP